ncbi:MAG: ribosome recycling factor [bacterium]
MEAETGVNQLISKVESGMQERVEKLRRELGSLRTGRANPQILDSVKVEYYGVPVPLKQVAAVTVPEPRTLEVRPWDITTLQDIYKAVMKTDLGASPVNDGKVVRISLPQMTEDRRKNMVKTIRKMGEDYKVSIRSDRRDALEKIKKAQKAGEITEDDMTRLEQTLQKLTNVWVNKIDDILSAKEKEILTV